MSSFSHNLNTQRDRLQLTVEAVVSEMAKRGHNLAYSTVAGWFNGQRGARWKVDELKALLEVLETDLESMTAGEVELVDEPVTAATAREMRNLTPEQQQAVLAMVRTMRRN